VFLSPGARARRSSSAVSVVVDEQRATAETAITAATHHHPPPPQPVCCLFLSLFLSLFFFSFLKCFETHRGNKDDVRFPDFHPFSCVVFFWLKKRRDLSLKSLSLQSSFSNSSLSRQTGLSSFPQNSLFSLSRV
jgi:hypothetical protein